MKEPLGTSSQPLRDLLDRVARSDAPAFAAFYDATAATLFARISSALSDPRVAEDVTARVYARVWHAASAYGPRGGDVSTWLNTLACREVIRAGPPRVT